MLGIIPRKLTKVNPPKCPTYMYGAMTRLPWRAKGQHSKINHTVYKKPGQCMSIDQVESSTPDLIAQIK